jgi:hypothetical protein
MKNKLTIGVLFMMSLASVAKAESLWNYLSNSYIESTSYNPPSNQNLIAAQNLFRNLLTNRVINISDQAEWRKLGFVIIEVHDEDDDFAVIKEIKSQGNGFYIVKMSGDSSDNVLEAPHRPSDLYTHEIIYKLLLEGNFSAAAINTTKRTNVDLGKETSSYYNAFTNAVASSFATPKLLQLHAFENDIRDLKADVILSSTKKEQNSIYDKIALCLKNKLIGTKAYITLQYPQDIQDLGGTQNINAKNFYQTNPKALFFHVETSKDLRDELRTSPELRAIFYKCIIGESDG